MCAPAAFMALQTGVKLASTITADQAQNQRAKATWANAKTNLLNQYTSVQTKEVQEQQKTGLQIIQANKQAQANSSRIRAQAAAGDIGGATEKEREQAPINEATDFASAAKMNLAAQLSQDQNDAASYQARAKSIINENPAVNPVGEAIQVAGEAAQGAQSTYGALNPTS